MSKYHKEDVKNKLAKRGIKVNEIAGTATITEGTQCGLKCLAWLDFLELVPIFRKSSTRRKPLINYGF